MNTNRNPVPASTVEDPMTGQRLTFLVTVEESGGEYVLVETGLPPRSPGPLMHYHLSYTERFDVVEGRLDMWVGGKQDRFVLGPGEYASAPPRVPHRFWNSGVEPVVFRAEIRPPQAWVRSGEAMRGLARDGRLNGKGIPKDPFELALIFELSDSYLTGMPLFAQKAIFGSLASIARWRGYDPEFSRYAEA